MPKQDQRRVIIWRYTKRGGVKHALISGRYISACGVRVDARDRWRGDRNERERLRLEQLLECSRCTHYIRTSPDQLRTPQGVPEGAR